MDAVVWKGKAIQLWGLTLFSVTFNIDYYYDKVTYARDS
jgi:hypothetical protein